MESFQSIVSFSSDMNDITTFFHKWYAFIMKIISKFLEKTVSFIIKHEDIT